MSEREHPIQPGVLCFRIGPHHAAMIRALLSHLGIYEGEKTRMMRLLVEGCHRRICQKIE